jgi:hypothetical protein
MIYQAALFKGTRYHNSIQARLYEDIRLVVNTFGNLRPANRPPSTSQAAIITLQGTVPIRMNNAVIQMPLLMTLPERFPNTPPVVTVSAPPGFVIVSSNSVTVDGYVSCDKLYPWIPGTSTLIALLQTITQCFSQSPPFRPTDGRTDFDELRAFVIGEALSRISWFNSETLLATEKVGEADLVAHLKSVAEALKNSLSSSVSDLRRQIHDAELELAEFDPNVPLDPAVMKKAKELAFGTTVNVLNQSFSAEKLSMEQLYKATQELGATHYQVDLQPD